MPSRSRLSFRLMLAWLLVAGGMLVLLPVRGQVSTMTWYYLAALALYLPSKTSMLLLLTGEEWRRLSWLRLLAYLLWWGMDLQPFLQDGEPASPPRVSLWLTASMNLVIGSLILWGVPRLLPEAFPLMLRLLIGMAGYVWLIVFGVGDLWTALYRLCGIPVEKLFVNPPAAVSLGDFWGRRWNRIFSYFARRLFFRPLTPSLGTVGASFVVFLYAGLLHEWAWSFPVYAGYGGPLAYFLIQWLGLMIEDSGPGRRLLRGKVLGRVWTWLIVVGPMPLLFHEAFFRVLVLDQLRAINIPGLSIE